MKVSVPRLTSQSGAHKPRQLDCASLSIGQKNRNISERLDGTNSENISLVLYNWEAFQPFLTPSNPSNNPHTFQQPSHPPSPERPFHMAAKTNNQQTSAGVQPFQGAHPSNSLGRDPSPARPPPPLQPQPGQVPKP